MKDFNDDIIEKFEQLTETHDEDAARRELRQMHPADIA